MEAQSIANLIIFGTLGMLLLAAVITIFIVIQLRRYLSQKQVMQQRELDHRKAMISAAIKAQEKERKKIAGDIHDDVATALQVAKLQASALKGKRDPEKLNELASSINSQLGDAIGMIRNISRSLSPPVLNKLGLANAMVDCLDKIKSTDEVQLEYVIDENCNIADKEDEIQIYRILVELLNNTLKYTQAKFIHFEMHHMNDHGAVFNIKHDGAGLTQQEAIELSRGKEAFGLNSTFSRALAIDADILYAESRQQITVTYGKKD